MNAKSKKEYQAKSISSGNELLVSNSIKGTFSEADLMEIFMAKCQDFKLQFNEKLYQKFIDRQKELSTSKVLRMESCGFGPIAAGIIVNCIYQNHDIRVVYFSDNFLGDEGAYCFADLIYNSNSLIAVDLGSNRMTDNGTRTIFSSLRTNSSIACLNIGSKTSIGRNIIGPKTVIEISEMLKENKIISELNLSMTELNSINITGICPGLTINKTLTHLNLSNNNIKSSGAISVLKSLYHSNIIELKMASNHITDDVGPYLSAFLSKNKNISFLDLSVNELGNRFMSSISGQSATNSTLEELILSRNPIGGRGIAAFGAYIILNKKLRVLTVNGCMIETNGFIEFCSDLERNESLQILRIQHNPLTDDGIIKLSETIKNNKFLKEIDLELVEMTDKGAYQLFPSLLESNIENLSIRNNLVHDGNFIQKSIQNNQKLMKLDIEFNDINYSLHKEIMKIIAANQKRWKDNENQRIKYELNHITSSDIQLNEVRKEIKLQREEIYQLKLEKAELERYLKSSDEHRIKRINELDEKNNILGKEVSILMDDCRNQKSEIITKKSQIESDISQLSSKLAREIEVLKTEFKTYQACEGKMDRFNSRKEEEEEKLNKLYKDAKLKYLDMKTNFIAAWQLAHQEKDLIEISENNKEIVADEPKNDKKQTKTKTKSKKETSSKAKSGKSTKKKTDKKNDRKTDQLDPNAPVDPKKQVDETSKQPDDVLITVPGNKVKI